MSDNRHSSSAAARLDGQRDGEVLLRLFQLLGQDVDGVRLEDRELAIRSPRCVLLLYLPFPFVPAQGCRREGEARGKELGGSAAAAWALPAPHSAPEATC